MGSMIDIETAGGRFAAYLSRPAAANAPAIVVNQEIFGINADMRETCDRLARDGYLAICPDLYWRMEPGVSLSDRSEAEWQRALALYQAFDVPNGVRDIAATIQHARAQLGAAKVGVMGYCLGGLLTYLAATRTDADASASYYGVGIEKFLGEAETLRKPLLMHLAEQDEFVPAEARQRIIETLGGRPQITIHRYPGCSHAFARNAGVHYDQAAAAAANERTARFFQQHLH
ncbi:MAG: dienelactone hydrolase family protein [Panacagrimonas sp.]